MKRQQPQRNHFRAHLGIVLGASLIHFVCISWILLRRVEVYSCFEDLDLFVNAFWNTLHGRLFYQFDMQICQLGVHFSPFLFLILPLYALLPDPRTLLLLQAAAASFAAVPFFLFSRKMLKSSLPAVLLSLAYLFYPPLNRSLLSPVSGFHEITFALPFVFLLAWAMLERRWVALGAFLILLLSVKENVALGVAAWGLWLLLRKRWRLGGLFVAGGVLWFCVAFFVIMPCLQGKGSFTPGALTFVPAVSLPWQEGGCSSFFRSCLRLATDPLRWRFIAEMLTPVWLGVLGCPEAMIAAAPIWMADLLDRRESMRTVYRWHHMGIIPFLFLGNAYALCRLQRGMDRWTQKRKRTAWDREKSYSLAAALILVSCLLSLFFMPFSFPDRDAAEISYRMNWDKAQRVDKVLSQIPPEASVLASFNVLYRLAGRKHVGWFRHAHRRKWDYVVWDAELKKPAPPNFQAFLSQNGYQLIWREGGFLVFKRF